MEWQPIGTAPQIEGPYVLVWRGKVAVDYWLGGPGPNYLPGTTHWMPWPEAGWLPIETAPPDGAAVLVKCDDPTEPYGYGVYENYAEFEPWRGEAEWKWSRSCDGEPTHWQAVPPPPG